MNSLICLLLEYTSLIELNSVTYGKFSWLKKLMVICWCNLGNYGRLSFRVYISICSLVFSMRKREMSRRKRENTKRARMANLRLQIILLTFYSPVLFGRSSSVTLYIRVDLENGNKSIKQK